MKKVLLFIILAILFLWRIGIWFKLSNSSNLNNDGKFLSCTEFFTENLNNKKLIEEVNLIKRERIKQLGLTCDTKTIIKIDKEKNKIIEASTIWGLYEQVINSKLRNYSLPKFIDEIYSDKISIDEKNRILEDIKNWLNDPQMPDDVRKQIEKGLSINQTF